MSDQFTSYESQSYDSPTYKPKPVVPESDYYGLIMTGLLLGLVGWVRWRNRASLPPPTET